MTLAKYYAKQLFIQLNSRALRENGPSALFSWPAQLPIPATISGAAFSSVPSPMSNPKHQLMYTYLIHQTLSSS